MTITTTLLLLQRFCRAVAAVLMKRKFSRVVAVAVAVGIGIVGKMKKLFVGCTRIKLWYPYGMLILSSRTSSSCCVADCAPALLLLKVLTRGFVWRDSKLRRCNADDDEESWSGFCC